MPSAAMADPVRQPLQAIAALFAQAGCPTTQAQQQQQQGDGQDWGVAAFFQRACGEDLSKVHAKTEAGARACCVRAQILP